MVIWFDATWSVELKDSERSSARVIEHIFVVLTRINSVQYSWRRRSASTILQSNNVCLMRIHKAMQSLRKLAGLSGWRAGLRLSRSSWAPPPSSWAILSSGRFCGSEAGTLRGCSKLSAVVLGFEVVVLPVPFASWLYQVHSEFHIYHDTKYIPVFALQV